jgi:predicted outer membrane protein
MRGQGSALTVVTCCALTLSFSACDRDRDDRKATRVAIVRDTAHSSADTIFEAAGDVVSEPSDTPVKERWISDANVLSLLNAMSARQIAAADVELESWHVESVRAFAASIAREHAELQHSVDSLARRLNLVLVSPALSKPWLSAMQAQIDSLRRSRGVAIDRAFVRQQIAAHQMMGDHIQQLASVAEHQELRSLLAATTSRVASQLARARSLETTLAAADSASADSVARRAARRARVSGDR